MPAPTSWATPRHASTDRTVIGGDIDNALGPLSAVAAIAYPVAALLFPERLG